MVAKSRLAQEILLELANPAEQYRSLLLLEGIAGQEIQQAHQASELQQATQQGDVIDGTKGCSGELERDSGEKGNAQQAGRRNQISEGIELGRTNSLEQLVEKLEGQTQQFPGRIPSSPIPSSPTAGAGHQGGRFGGPNLYGGYGLRIKLEIGRLNRLGEINLGTSNFRGINLGDINLKGLNVRSANFRVTLFNPMQVRVVEQLGFHFRLKSEIA